MKNFIKILILPIAIITMFSGFAPKVFAVAVTPLSVQFSPNPLFNKLNFLPLDETSGTVTVKNNSGTTQTIATEAINVLDNNNFGNLLHLKILGDSGTLFDNSLANFFSTAGEFSLGTISSRETKTFTYTISFIDSNDNSYQGKTLGFDVCVGFLGGNTHCGNTVLGGEGDTGGGGGTTGGGTIHGSGGSIISLIIFNEQARDISSVGQIGSATITWNTNLLSTSQVVYGLASEGPYTLILTPPNFGYPLATAEDSTKVINHSMFLTNLIPGQTYLYRVISRASPPTVSIEHQFTVPLATGLVLGASTENNNGSVLGSTSNGATAGSVLGETTSVPEETPSLNNNLAAILASGFGNILSICNLIALLILLIIYLIWRIWLRKKYEKDLVGEEEIRNRFWLFFGGSSLLAILVVLILNEYCPLPVFLIVFIASICFYGYRKLRVK